MRWNYIWNLECEWKTWMETNIGKVALQSVWEQRVEDCTRCKLHEMRTNIVFGIGNTESPDYCFVGEGPGAVEDSKGEPFVGKAGKLLNKMIGAMGLKREDIYLCNVVSCRPPGNRNPESDELDACASVWRAQLIAVRPKVIVALGAVAGNALLGTHAQEVGVMRKKMHLWNKTPVQVTYHPAAMLRDDKYKQPAWEDLQEAMRRLRTLKVRAAETGPLFEEV